MKKMQLGRFSDAQFLILSSLANGPKHGYAMMEDITSFSGTELEPGTLYGAISRLQEKGWIAPLPVEDRRRPYQITGTGLELLSEQVRTLERVTAVGRRRLATHGGDGGALGSSLVSPGLA